MMYLKLMSDQNLPDSDPSHDFVMIQLGDKDELAFARQTLSNGAQCPDSTVVSAIITCEDGSQREIRLTGNAYVLNAQGKTIASRAAY